MEFRSFVIAGMLVVGSFALGQEEEETAEEKKPANPFYAELKVIVSVQAKLEKAQGGSKARYAKLLAEAKAQLAKAVATKKRPLLKRMSSCKRDLAKAGSKTRKKAVRARMKQVKEQLAQVDEWAAEDISARDAPEEEK